MKANNHNNGDFISVGEATDSKSPLSWNSALLGNILLHRKGKKPKRLEGLKWDGSVPYIDIEAFETGRIRKYADPDSSVIVEEGDVLIVWDGARCGHVGKAPTRGALGSTLMALTSSSLCEGYLLRFLQLLYETINSNPRGTGIPHVDPEVFWNLEMPIAPAEEQKRIVAKIEELLPKVNAVRERLLRVKEIMKRFRQSVLSAACSGRLTEDWRNVIPAVERAQTSVATQETNKNKARKGRAGRLWGAGVLPDLTNEELNSLPKTWIWVKVRDLGDNLDDAVQVGPMSMRSRDFTDFGVPVLNVGCVQWGYFEESKLNHLPRSLSAMFERYLILKNDILFTRSGTVGRCAIATQAQEGYLMTFHLLRVRTDQKKCLPEYLQIVFRGAPHIRRQTEEGAIGSTRAGFNTNLLAGLGVPLPPVLEQREIVRRVDALFKLADKIEKRIETELSRTDKMTQAILAKAFRGELVAAKDNSFSPF